MPIPRNVVSDNGLQRLVIPGDVVAGGETILASDTSNAITITAQKLVSGHMLRAPTGAATDTIDSAANIIAAIGRVAPGVTLRLRWIVTTANAITVAATANTGITVNRGAVAASSSREFLVTFVNGTPAQTITATAVNGSAVVSGFTADQLALLSIGMVVTNAVAGLQGATIASINYAAGTVTMSANANSSTTAQITFSPVIQIDGL
jgi:hypothetical protein